MKAAWDKLRGPSGKLGAPLGDQAVDGDVVSQKFAGGKISWNRAKNTFTTDPSNLAPLLSGLQVSGQNQPSGAAMPSHAKKFAGHWWYLLAIIALAVLLALLLVVFGRRRRRAGQDALAYKHDRDVDVGGYDAAVDGHWGHEDADVATEHFGFGEPHPSEEQSAGAGSAARVSWSRGDEAAARLGEDVGPAGEYGGEWPSGSEEGPGRLGIEEDPDAVDTDSIPVVPGDALAEPDYPDAAPEPTYPEAAAPEDVTALEDAYTEAAAAEDATAPEPTYPEAAYTEAAAPEDSYPDADEAAYPDAGYPDALADAADTDAAYPDVAVPQTPADAAHPDDAYPAAAPDAVDSDVVYSDVAFPPLLRCDTGAVMPGAAEVRRHAAVDTEADGRASSRRGTGPAGRPTMRLPLTTHEVPDGYPISQPASVCTTPLVARSTGRSAEIWLSSEEVAQANGFRRPTNPGLPKALWRGRPARRESP